MVVAPQSFRHALIQSHEVRFQPGKRQTKAVIRAGRREDTADRWHGLAERNTAQHCVGDSDRGRTGMGGHAVEHDALALVAQPRDGPRSVEQGVVEVRVRSWPRLVHDAEVDVLDVGSHLRAAS
jgi:hypothetical protein